MEFLDRVGIKPSNSGVYCGRWIEAGGDEIASHSPATGGEIAKLRLGTVAEYETTVAAAHAAFLRWREVPAPRRGDYVRRMGERLRERKEELGRLVSLEAGKIIEEGRGEVQEAIDIADFAVGLSRQLYGLTIASERPQHAMRETWHPLGVVGVISAFNFPAAVWAWNAMIALVCGDAVLWKPSPKAALTALAMTNVCAPVLEEDGFGALLGLCCGEGSDVGAALTHDRRVPLVSATGSTRMGKLVGEVVGARLGRTILELGGNNAIIVLDDADLDMALRAILFGAVGTAGQRCTSTRRLIVQSGVRAELERRLVDAYATIAIGDPLDEDTLMGPLIDAGAVADMQTAIERATAAGGEVLRGGGRLTLEGDLAGGHYVDPCIIRMPQQLDIVCEETFAPILYILEVSGFDAAMAMHNAVPQGLSSAIFTSNISHAERFLSAIGSDCGIANVNLGTSGAEIGGAFGGEKETGGGRESGSDSWKAYMRRMTSTINWGNELPLAQGIKFGD
ncbi:MAG: aldehyde dehydrogenase family protein [Planctomycetes bacterium]|jgi:aldehyde dehydrogenase (NAD+)|nr:aldehyde dehydrogenase family protein [Planctomycetota bacterium]MDP6424183.1 aldehyde dehydrogenase family protein [Planctomycetota bacterium]